MTSRVHTCNFFEVKIHKDKTSCIGHATTCTWMRSYTRDLIHHSAYLNLVWFKLPVALVAFLFPVEISWRNNLSLLVAKLLPDLSLAWHRVLQYKTISGRFKTINSSILAMKLVRKLGSHCFRKNISKLLSSTWNISASNQRKKAFPFSVQFDSISGQVFWVSDFLLDINTVMFHQSIRRVNMSLGIAAMEDSGVCP